jgi:polyisoprenoid-binding protein YceI
MKALSFSALALSGMLAGLCSTAFAAPETFQFDEAHTYPSFEVNHLGWSTTRGVFQKASGKAMLDFAAKTGSVELTVDAASITTLDKKRDDHLRSEDFFNVAKFPKIVFRSDKVKFEGDKVVGADGQLTMLGVTKPVSLAFSQFKCGDHPIYKGKYYCAGDASTTIKRSEFGITIYPGGIGEDVKLNFQVEAARGG